MGGTRGTSASASFLQHVRVHIPLAGVRPSWPYESIFRQEIVVEMHNLPIFKRRCNPKAAPISVVFHQSFDSQASAYRKHSDDFHSCRSPIFRMRRIETIRREEGI